MPWLFVIIPEVWSILVLFAYLVTKSCPVLCDPMDCSMQGFSVHGVFQVRTLKWVVISSWGLPNPVIEQVSSAVASRFISTEPHGNPWFCLAAIIYWYWGFRILTVFLWSDSCRVWESWFVGLSKSRVDIVSHSILTFFARMERSRFNP